MKKLFSLVALAGMFMLMSFNYTADDTQVNCFQQASDVADFYMLSPFNPWGGEQEQYEVAEMIFDAVYDICSAEEYGIEDCIGC